MNIVFLNTWNGKRRDELAQFIKDASRNTDIFCFQEMYLGMSSFCGNILRNYQAINMQGVNDNNHFFSQTIFFNNKVKLISSEEVLSNQSKAGLGFYAHFTYLNQNIHLCNFHGTAFPVNKLDDPIRIGQSQGLIDFFKNKTGLKIIGGDFNLLPETESIKMFEKNNYLDLIKKFEIDTTRNELAWKKYPDNKQKYADYVFVSPEVEIKKFSVPKIEVSDHLPLILSFN